MREALKTDWAALVSAHEAMIWRTAYRILGHHDDALDCCQDAVVEAYEYASANDVRQWAPLLRTLVTRRAIDRLRRREAMRKRVEPIHDDAAIKCPASGPSERAEASELIERLRKALTALSEKEAEVFWLACVEQMSHGDISRQLSITANESRVLLHRARSKLEARLTARPIRAVSDT